MKYPVVEVFTSIQGEGRYTGYPANFIRLAGCPLNCEFCDTDKEQREELSTQEILERLNEDVKITVLTGGEPTHQDIYDLVHVLSDCRNYEVHLETNGWNGWPQGIDWVSLSPKRIPYTPSGYDPFEHGAPDEIKWLVPLWTHEEMRGYLRSFKHVLHYVQPVNYRNRINRKNLELCKQMVRRDPRLKLSLQLHKVIHVR